MARLMDIGLALLLICALASFCESKPYYRWAKRWYFKRGGNAVDRAGCMERLNEIRAAHGAEPLEWDPYLEKHAMTWANYLAETNTLGHDPEGNLGDKEGENLYISRSGSANCVDALNHWYKELQIYKAKGACASPPENGVPGTEDFTHMVWKSSNKVAVAVVGKVVVARFFPPGNFEAEYEFDVQC